MLLEMEGQNGDDGVNYASDAELNVLVSKRRFRTAILVSYGKSVEMPSGVTADTSSACPPLANDRFHVRKQIPDRMESYVPWMTGAPLFPLLSILLVIEDDVLAGISSSALAHIRKASRDE